ncbi:MAG: tyrosine-type recombinase/integrase [Euryarchaeota archaeon]|nr:tyrosine-type recombinase/integrase [Euryarchaeota archaeon]
MKSNEELLAEFLEDAKMRDWSVWPINSCKYTICIFFKRIQKSCLKVDMEDLKKFLMYLKSRPGRFSKKVDSETIRKHINNLASFYEFLEFEDHIVRSPVPKFRKRYLRISNKKNSHTSERQLISVEQMSTFVNSILDPQEKAIVCVLAKTGVRAGELMAMDVSDIDWLRYSIKLKPTGKRSNLTVYFDNESAKCLKRWLDVRHEVTKSNALFVNPSNGKRITYPILNDIVKKHAIRLGIHDDNSPDLSKRFSAHCCRHWFTTHLRRAGMPREFRQELRGDSRDEPIDTYDHIDHEELRQSYLSTIPQLGL